jgi:small subunit ribosomal protein S16
MLKMRLQRIGRKNEPSFRVIVTDSRQGPKSGKNVDSIGFYNPKSGEIEIDGERAKDWIAKGVQVSDTVHNMLVSKKVIEGKKVNVLPKKSPIVSEEAEASEATVSETKAEEPATSEETTAEESATSVEEEAEENTEKKEETAEATTPTEPEEKKNEEPEVKETEQAEEAPKEEEQQEETKEEAIETTEEDKK